MPALTDNHGHCLRIGQRRRPLPVGGRAVDGDVQTSEHVHRRGHHPFGVGHVTDVGGYDDTVATLRLDAGVHGLEGIAVSRHQRDGGARRRDSKAEEQVVYPAINAVAPDEASNVDDGLAEHHHVEESLKDLMASDPEAPGVDGLIAAMISEVRRHVEEEEHDIAQVLRRRLQPATQRTRRPVHRRQGAGTGRVTRLSRTGS